MFICDRNDAGDFLRLRATFAAIAVLLAVPTASHAAEAKRKPPSPLRPAEALARFQIEPGLRIELVAAEPLVVDPVAFVFDENRRLFVAEGRGYPDPLGGKGRTTEGRIALLEDTDGDGQYEQRREFATGMGYVNGLAVWRGGLFVTSAPDILYLKDTDGDGIADVKRVVLTGFDDTKTAQIRVSHPTLGLDGWIYVTSGLNGGKVTSPEHPERPTVTFTPRDSRFNPDTLEFENTGGRGQFGLTFDPFGRRFEVTNRHPVLQVMLEPWHLRRNPHLAFGDMVQEVSKVESQAKVFPISRANVTADFMPKLMGAPHAGTFTAACGLVVFGGTALTPEHVGNVFICEPAQNLIQRQVFRAAGASLRSDPPYRGKEFLASPDVWFRPVFLGNGPDGALYVADMYRAEIDHPQYVPEESRGLLDFESGKGLGRIYRIVKDGPRPAAKPAATSAESVTQLVAGLDSADEWWRERAYRLLLERGDRAAIPPLEKVARGSSRPEARTRALWALRSMGGLSTDLIAAALDDADARVREQAVQLAGEKLPAARELLKPVLASARDADPRVRFCSALVLGSIEDAVAVPALASIAVRDGEDRWTRAAVLSGIGSRMPEFLAALQQSRGQNPPAFAAVMEHLGRVFGAGATPDACREFLLQMLNSEEGGAWRFSSVLGLAEGLRGRTKAKADANVFASILGGKEGAPNAALQKFFRAAAERATDGRAPTPERVTVTSLLGYTDMDFAGAALTQLLDARQPPELQLQAVRAFERLGDPRGGAILIKKENWTRYTPAIREAVVAALTSKPPLIEVLFDAIRGGVIAAPEISSVRRTQLLKHANAEVKKGAEAIFKEIEGGDRMKVYRTYRELLNTNVDVARGREAFVRACSACHTYEGQGGKVGPDLSGVRNQPADALLLHILVPNYEVAPSYQTLSIVIQDGRSFSGWLASETESSLTLRTAAGTEETVLRRNITSLNASGVSLMPDGLEQTMAKDEVASLIAFLKNQ
ncbi:MAG: HEAT repeat domain-containing protein [Opitutaceae bacterium]|nr:HEAT repeat domain-containing protein [Opitutaceae bacterium]